MSIFGRSVAAFALTFALLGCAAHTDTASYTSAPPGFTPIPGTQTSVLVTGSVGTTISSDSGDLQAQPRSR